MMKKSLLIQPNLIVAIVCLLNMACQEQGGQLNTGDGVRTEAGTAASQSVHDTTKTVPIMSLVQPTNFSAATWQDSLIVYYIQNTENELVRHLRSDKRQLQWLFDRMEATDSAAFYVYSVGNTVQDSDGSRWAVVQWLFLDSARHQLYEYDVAEDALRAWTRRQQ